jgi:hypothetical protein
MRSAGGIVEPEEALGSHREPLLLWIGSLSVIGYKMDSKPMLCSQSSGRCLPLQGASSRVASTGRLQSPHTHLPFPVWAPLGEWHRTLAPRPSCGSRIGAGFTLGGLAEERAARRPGPFVLPGLSLGLCCCWLLGSPSKPVASACHPCRIGRAQRRRSRAAPPGGSVQPGTALLEVLRVHW